MITIFRNSEQGLKVIPEPVPGCWFNVVDPTPDELSYLERHGFRPDHLSYALDVDEMPRTERLKGGHLVVLLRLPYFQGEVVDLPYTTLPLGLVITAEYIATVCKRPSDILQEVGRIKGLSTAKHNRFILHVLLSAASKYLVYLREISRVNEALEDRLQQSIRNKEVLELMKYQKCLTYFTTALKGNELMMERLQRSQIFKMYPEDEELLDDALTENQQAIEMTNIQTNILSGLMDAFASIISNNLNEVIKLLTSITLVLSFPSIVVGFYGMNVTLPFMNHPLAYLIILGISLLLSLGVALYLRWRDWF